MASSSSTPIPFQASEPIAINNDRCRSNSRHSLSSSSSDDEDGGRGPSGISSALHDSDSFGDLRVGSLPMHLRRPGRGGARHRQGPMTRSGGFLGPQSLPHPRAPFLSSREEPKDMLSSMPSMVLPESATSTDPDTSSVPYGSLRESQFARPQNYGRGGSGGFGGIGNSHATTLATNRYNQNGQNSFQPQSLPAYSGFSGMSGLGGLGAQLNEAENNNMPSNPSGGPGIGGLLQDTDDNLNHGYNIGEITDGCSQLQLGESANISGTNRFGHETLDRNRFDGNPSDTTPLSTSLTALEFMTLSRHSPTDQNRTTTNVEHPKPKPDLTSYAPQQNMLQTPPFDCFPAQHGFEGEASTYNHENDDPHGNPDTFEAFDLELDE